MFYRRGRTLACWLGGVLASSCAFGQKPLNWQEVQERFRANNPGLAAGRLMIDESRASEITAGLRPNPALSSVNDEFHIFHPNPLQPFQNTQLTQTLSFLFERRQKRQLRVASARLATSMAAADSADLERNLLFSLRDAFLRVLYSKALVALAAENLKYYDRVIELNRARFQAGDISQADLTRVELQRAQFESDAINSAINLRTAKLALLALMNEKQPLDRFDVAGEFDYHDAPLKLEEARQAALEARPDLRSAVTAIQKADADHRLAWANGSTDPTVGLEYQRTGPDNTMGIGVAIPLRIFDRNQGEKLRTELEMRRTERVRENLLAGIYRDVDSAYVALENTKQLLKAYRDRYLGQSASVRDTVSFAYSKGGASLLEFLDAQKSYRDTQLAYRSLIASYLSAANQLNLAAGREVIP